VISSLVARHPFVYWGKHVVANRSDARVVVCKRVWSDPFDYHGALVQALFGFNPSDKARINIEVFLRIAQHDDAAFGCSGRHRNVDDVSECDGRSVRVLLYELIKASGGELTGFIKHASNVPWQ
jgi:hypothetical protein